MNTAYDMNKDLQKPVILVVDDEPSIQKVLEGVLTDAGFSCLFASSGSEALEKLADSGNREKPSLVLLDIWMPGLDGIETLKEIHTLYPDLPVVMISGHATIATAVQATKMGAQDFIEKPLDLDVTLSAIERALSKKGLEKKATTESKEEEGIQFSPAQINVDKDLGVLGVQLKKGTKFKQRTIAHSAIVYGQGLHSGTKSGLMLEPLPAGSGIHFAGVSDTLAVPAHVKYVESTGFATTLKLGSTQVSTIEHLLSALHAYKISNLLIKCNDEVPVLDGSSSQFCQLLEDTGIEEQDGELYSIKIDKTIRVGDEKEFIQIEPGDGFTIDYTLEYPLPLGKQHMVFSLSSEEDYKKEIAPARTFGFVKDIGNLQKIGLAQGGRFDNFVLYGDEGAINGELRFSDEAVRHKILDAIGDLYLLGRPLEGKVTARMTGHSDNIDLLGKIYEMLVAAG